MVILLRQQSGVEMRISLPLLIVEMPGDDLLALRITELVAISKRHHQARPNLDAQPHEQVDDLAVCVQPNGLLRQHDAKVVVSLWPPQHHRLADARKDALEISAEFADHCAATRWRHAPPGAASPYSTPAGRRGPARPQQVVGGTGPASSPDHAGDVHRAWPPTQPGRPRAAADHALVLDVLPWTPPRSELTIGLVAGCCATTTRWLPGTAVPGVLARRATTCFSSSLSLATVCAANASSAVPTTAERKPRSSPMIRVTSSVPPLTFRLDC